MQLSGNISMKEGEPFVHAHVVLGGPDFQCRSGHLFAANVAVTVELHLLPLGFEIERRKIELADPIKQIGDYEVSIRLHREVSVAIPVHVVPLEGATIAAPEDEAEEGEQEAEEES